MARAFSFIRILWLVVIHRQLLATQSAWLVIPAWGQMHDSELGERRRPVRQFIESTFRYEDLGENLIK